MFMFYYVQIAKLLSRCNMLLTRNVVIKRARVKNDRIKLNKEYFKTYIKQHNYDDIKKEKNPIFTRKF